MTLSFIRSAPNRLALAFAETQVEFARDKNSERYAFTMFVSLYRLAFRVALFGGRLLNLFNPFGEEGWHLTTTEDLGKRLVLLGNSFYRLPQGVWHLMKSVGLCIADKVTWGSWHRKVERGLEELTMRELREDLLDCRDDIHISDVDEQFCRADGLYTSMDFRNEQQLFERVRND